MYPAPILLANVLASTSDVVERTAPEAPRLTYAPTTLL
jgi:hypothetical protein